MKVYDYVVIGGGVFGVYAALYLSSKGIRVLLIEKEKELMQKATIVNQARLHSGYHYPRSIATARLALDYKNRFLQEHRDFINSKYEQYYAIDKYSTFTNRHQYERFCRFLDIKAEKVRKSSFFDFSNTTKCRIKSNKVSLFNIPLIKVSIWLTR